MSRLTPPLARAGALVAVMLGTTAAASAQAANALPYSRGYLLTGNYVVGSLDFTEKAQPANAAGFSTGEISIEGVPADADIVAAYLYWETITNQSELSQARGVKFRRKEILLNDVMAVKKSSTRLSGATAGCWSSGTPLMLTHFRADVLRHLPVRLDGDGKKTGKRLVNTSDLEAHAERRHEVTLPTREGNQIPESAGATLLIVYRDPSEPLRKIVVYDGLHVQPSVSAVMTQRLQGFYKSAANPKSARLTHIVASGQPNGTERLYFNNGQPSDTILASDPFSGGSASQRWWGATTHEVGDLMTPGNGADSGFGETATTRVEHSGGGKSGYDCLTWGAIVFSTTVADVDHDGLPDGIEDATTRLSDPPSSTRPEGQPLPDLRAMGASSAQQDLFVEFNAMETTADKVHGSVRAPYPNSPTPTKVVPPHTHMPTPEVLKLLGDLYASRGIRAHFDVGDWTTFKGLPTVQHPNWTDDYDSNVADQYLIPSALARGGEVMDERACDGSSSTCQFPAYPGTVSWKVGFQVYRDAPVGEDGEELSTGELASWRDGQRRRFDADRKGLFHYVLNAHARGKPRSFLPCLVNGEPAEYDTGGGKACTTVNPDFHIPSSASGVADLPGGNAMVTLGFWDEHVGRPFVRASTTFHEIGHNLNLWHGGRAAVWGNKVFKTDADPQSTIVQPNCKPTYQSAMSYLFQVHGLFDDNDEVHLDFSGAEAAFVDEPGGLVDAQLFPPSTYRPVWYAPADSQLALDQGSQAATRFCSGGPFDPTEPPAPTARVRAARADSPLDWNGDTLINNGLPNQDVNFDGDRGRLEGFDDWANLRFDQIGAGRHAVKFQDGDLLDFGSGDFLDFGSGDEDFVSGDFLDFGSGDFLDFGSGDFLDFGSGDFLDFGSGVVFDRDEGDFLDFGSGDFLDFGSGDFLDFGSGDFLDFGSGSERQELDFEFAASLGRGAAYRFNACVIGQDADCPAANPFTPTYHRIQLTWKAPTFGSVFAYLIERKRGPASSTFAYAPIGSVATEAFTEDFINGELPHGLEFTYRTRTEFDDQSPHAFSGYSVPVTETAVNQAPVANDDAYTVSRNATTRIAAAQGVRANDSDIDSPLASIKAVIVTQPSNGTLLLRPDGSFDYRPKSGYTGPDSFTYKANNGVWSGDPSVPMSADSNVATVTITVVR